MIKDLKVTILGKNVILEQHYIYDLHSQGVKREKHCLQHMILYETNVI